MKYQKKIYWVTRKFVLNHDDADDITQEVFVKLYKSLSDFRGESALYTYIYKMAVNYSLNHIKKTKTTSSVTKGLDDEAFRIKSGEKNPDENYDNKLNSGIIKEAIQSLPEQQRTVFTLRFYEELSYEEIAKITNTSVGGLKANYFHAFKKIRTIIKEKTKRI
ncbi:MAG: sigma-70 family RNA polymerase sigma factor [Ignavibacteriae bacterium]|nr:sigma-70 family RNA polymerase sigma factor [Ignavibacteriota bacterium]